MLRELINRKPIQYYPLNESDRYFPSISSNAIYSRQTSTALKTISLRNFVYKDVKTKNLFVNFEQLQQCKDDKFNFVSVIGCELNQKSQNLIQISQQPLTIINGISYFLLSSQSCCPEVLKLIYTLSQSLYISQKFLSEFQSNLYNSIDPTQTWDIHNSLYLVSKNMNQNQSQLRTTTETYQFHQFYDHSSQHNQKSNNLKQSFTKLQKYFSQIYIISYASISSYDPHIIKQHLMNQFSFQTSRWFSYNSILLGYEKHIHQPKIVLIKQFHTFNQKFILDELSKKVLNNYSIFSYQILNNVHHQQKQLAKPYSDQNSKQQQKQNEKQKIRQKYRQKQKQQIQKFKKTLLQPFLEHEDTWIGRTELFKQRQLQIRQKITQQLQKLIILSKQKDENRAMKQIMKEAEQQKNFEVIGNSKYDSVYLNLNRYIEELKPNFQQIITNSFLNKQWRQKNKVILNNSDLLSNLQTRIQINQRKKEGLEQAIRLATKEQNYLNELVFSINDKKSNA